MNYALFERYWRYWLMADSDLCGVELNSSINERRFTRENVIKPLSGNREKLLTGRSQRR